MADKKISQLTGATTPLAGTEVLPIVQGGSTVKVSAADITAGRAVSAGSLTVNGAAVINESGADADFRVEGDTNANLIFADASADSVGIGTNAPWSFFTVGSGGTANPAATVSLHRNTVNEYRLKLTSSSFATGEWLGIGMGYSDNYMKVGLFAESLDGNGRADFHIALNDGANSGNAALGDKKLTVNYGGNVTVHSGNVKIGTAGKGIDFSGGLIWRTGTGTPEGAVTAPVGSLFTRTDGGANTTLYVKESGAGNTGWVAK